MHAGERHLHLSLDSRDLRDTEVRRLPSGILKQRRLSDPRLATDDKNGTLASTHFLQQPVEQLALLRAVQEDERLLATKLVGGWLDAPLPLGSGDGRHASLTVAYSPSACKW
jgi:hypothetical protein